MQKNIEFGSGKLHKIKPSSLIDKEGTIDKIDSFFLILALIYNDLKGLVCFDNFIRSHKPPDLKIVSGPVGEYMGFKLQIFKLVSSCVYEIMLLIEDNSLVILSNRFLRYVSKLSGQDSYIWKLLLDIANKKGAGKQDQKNKEFRDLLVKIRNNVTFHYHQSGKTLAIGFRNHFFKHGQEVADSFNFAYYSLQQTNFYNNRFYYADAALEGYLNNCIGSIDDKNKVGEIIYDLLAKISKVIAGLLEQYLKEKPMA